MPSFWQSNIDALVEQFLNIRVPSEARFAEHLLARRFVRKIELAGVNFIHIHLYKCGKEKDKYFLFTLYFTLDLRNINISSWRI